MASGMDLSLRRTFMAQERTLMAWIRTSVCLISFGFSIYKFFDYLAKAEQAPGVVMLRL
jgi:inner membrane protein YidH